MTKQKRSTPMATARRKNELAKLNLDTILRKRKAAIIAKYDATEASVMRRKPQTETQGEGGVYDMRRRQLGNNIGRDLERNYSSAKGIIHQFRMNVVGPLGKLQVNAEGGAAAAQWFNGVWAKDCDFRDDMHFSTHCQNVVAGVLREGDLLAVVDDGVTEEDSGKLLHWESDQIVPLTTLTGTPHAEAVQDNGILRATDGRVIGWVTTAKHGLQSVEYKDATIYKRGIARLIKNPWRFNQGRGVPSVITSATNFLDLYEMLGAELASAKRASVIAAIVKRDNAETDYESPGTAPEYLGENLGKSTATVDAEAANSSDPTMINYERIENLTGGYTEYLDAKDTMEFPDIKRPNIALASFLDAVLGYAGASMGLAKAYSLLRADSSYTSFRGDMVLSWVTFLAMQKWLERTYADWVAVKVLAWAQRKNKIAKLPDGWEQTLSWKWPVMPSVDEAKESIAVAQKLKNGTIDYSDLNGPDWRDKFDALSEQFEYGREKKLPLSAFEQKSGGVAPSEEDATKKEPEEE